ncbi:methyl-accepting chemotaxis protein [Methylobacterium sp. 092160098-2]|uniref:methyl-accepting chemotaxis protein n=1 Tax=Methylobacterium sp. 092160098-2 TaxID=3025129 RepID=UPI002381CB6E|nr:methyl-accepting chemotaxis protein [Methylobacterium sp. 092160098-2]MDE4911768.1 methyl-accepting chemotaxis protein [Methylobacterium sp. 092160098-2]
MGVMLLAVRTDTLLSAVEHAREGQRVVTLTRVSRTLLRSVIATRMARGIVQKVLAVEGPISVADRADQLSERQALMDAETEFWTLVRDLAVPSVQATLEPLRSAQATLAALRPQIDAVVALPRERRDAAFRQTFDTAVTSLLNAFAATNAAVDAAIPRRDTAVAQALDIKRASWATRVALGNSWRRMETSVAAKASWSQEEIIAAAEERGRLMADWGKVVDLFTEDVPVALRAAFQKAQASNFEGESARRRVAITDALSRGRAPGIEADALRARDIADGRALLDLAHAGLDAMIDRAQLLAAESQRALFGAVLFLTAAVLLAVGGIVIVFRWVLRPLRAMTQAMQALAGGDADVPIPARERRDEIGAMAAAVQVFRDNLVRTRALEAEAAEAALAAEAQRRSMTLTMAQGFESAVAGIVGQVSAAAAELQTTAWQMTTTAQQTASQSDTVAAAVEELGTSVQEIARQVQGSSELARAAVGEADRTAVLVAALNTAAARVDAVVELIAGIAAQTNLLALNATIEAARAGEAGRGFAVVATEVKDLAAQTGRATEEIGRQIGDIQTVTGQAVEAIGTITGRIGEISAVAAAIAAAVEQQGVATQEIVRNITQVSTGTQEVTGTIAGVAQAADQTGRAADHVLTAATALTRQSEQLAVEVGRFLAGVRAA